MKVVGLGARTPLGRGATASAAAVRAGLSCFARVHDARVTRTRSFTVARTTYLPAGLPVDGRLLALATGALEEALSPLHDVLRGAARIPLFVGLPSLRPGLSESTAPALTGALVQLLSERGLESDVAVFAEDHAAGLAALAEAARRIQAGEEQIAVVGGVESYLDPSTLAWLHEREQLKSEANRWGFVAGEGAGFVVLASAAAAGRWELPARAGVLGWGVARERVRPRTDEPCRGFGLSEALRAAIAVLPEGERAHEIICDLNGERHRGEEYGFTVPRIARRLEDPGSFLAPATAWGDLGAASGPLFVALAVHAGERGYARGPRALLWTSAEGGARGAALIDVPTSEEARRWA